MLRELLYEERYFTVFILVTIVLGGGAGWLTGRAIAHTWRPWWKVLLATLLLGVAVRFIHFALFEATFFSLHYYIVDTLFALMFATAGYRVTRSRQMAQQYGFLRSP
jgi:NO-binding membrane sensor protein with MHYT domain